MCFFTFAEVLLLPHDQSAGMLPRWLESNIRWSRFCNDAESQYAPIEGEATAIAWALAKCPMFVMGCPNLTVVIPPKSDCTVYHKQAQFREILFQMIIYLSENKQLLNSPIICQLSLHDEISIYLFTQLLPIDFLDLLITNWLSRIQEYKDKMMNKQLIILEFPAIIQQETGNTGYGWPRNNSTGYKNIVVGISVTCLLIRSIISHLIQPVRELDQSSHTLYSQVGGWINQLTPYTAWSMVVSII